MRYTYRDHFVSSVLNERVRDKLRDLSLEKALDIIRISEIKAEQAKAWNSIGDTDMHAMRKGTRTKRWGKHGNEAERRPRETNRTTTGIVVNCSFCGKTHDRGKYPAWGRKCRVCQGLNHFAAKCRKLKARRDVKTVETEQYSVGSLKDDSATQHLVNCVNRRQTEPGYILLGIESNRVKFECDTGSQCNILPLSDYKLATGDTNLKKLTRVSDTLTVYSGMKVKVMVTTTLQVHRNAHKHNLHFKVMSGKQYQPLQELTHKDSEFTWNESYAKAVRVIHVKLSNTPVLRYYDMAH